MVLALIAGEHKSQTHTRPPFIDHLISLFGFFSLFQNAFFPLSMIFYSLNLYSNLMQLCTIPRIVNIAAMKDEIVIGKKNSCSSDYRAINFKISVDRLLRFHRR
jgi:hypothetical protein